MLTLVLRHSTRHHRLFHVLLFSAILSSLATTARAESKLRFSGNLQSNLFVGLKPETSPSLLGAPPTNNLGRLFDYRNSNSLFLTMDAKVSSNLVGQARVQIRNLNFSRVTVSNDLQDYNQIFPVSVRLHEMYIDFLNITEWFDLRVGQQRIAWGKSLAFNPTDNLNPFNLENPLEFQERLPTPAIKGSFYFGEHVTLTLVAQPFFVPAVLPISLFRDVATVDFNFSSLVPEGIRLGQIFTNERVQQIDFNLSNMQAAAKISLEFSKISMSFSYFWGRLFVPIPAAADLVNAGDISKSPISPTVNVDLVYPRVHVIGFDVSTSLGPVGVWAEVGVFVPAESYELSITQSAFPNLDPKNNPITGRPFCPPPGADGRKVCPDSFPGTPFPKVTVGMEYTFPGGFYVNMQYLFGFFNEQALEKLHHFIFLVMRQPLFRERLLIQVTLGGELDATRTSGEAGDGSAVGLAFLVNAEIQFKPFDSGMIALGGVIGRGNKGTTLALFQDLDQIFLRCRLDF